MVKGAWSAAECEAIMRLAGTCSARQIARRFHRTEAAVYAKAKSLGLTFSHHSHASAPWGGRDDVILAHNVTVCPDWASARVKTAAETDRPESVVVHHANLLGLRDTKRAPVWPPRCCLLCRKVFTPKYRFNFLCARCDETINSDSDLRAQGWAF